MRMVDCLYWNDVRYWRMGLLIVALLLLFLLLVIGGPIEDILHRRWGRALDKSEEK